MRQLRVFVLAVALCASLAGCSGGGDPRPLIVVFVLDTVRADALGCYGNSNSPTPSIDRVAGDGVRFDQAMSSSGWTLPAVASLLTGTWPILHGATGRGISLTPIREEVATAPEVLKSAGYTTLGFANAAFVSPMLGIDRGFDVFDHNYTYNWNARRADETIDAALKHLDTAADSPAFYFIHLFDPHLNYDPPGEYRYRYAGQRVTPAPPLTMEACESLATAGGGVPSARDVAYVKGIYLGEIAFLDAQVGRFIDVLRERGLYDDAMVIVTADHGEEFWDHGGFEHGHTLYDELVHVPLIIKFPQAVTGVVDEQVRVLDVMPTVFDVAAIDVPDSFIGSSLYPLASGEVAADRVAFLESTLYGPRLIAWRGPQYKYVMNLDDRSGQLFDWRSDPRELHELTDVVPDEAATISAQLVDSYTEMAVRARHMSRARPVDMSPDHIDKLRSLGYIR